MGCSKIGSQTAQLLGSCYRDISADSDVGFDLEVESHRDRPLVVLGSRISQNDLLFDFKMTSPPQNR